VTYSAPEPSSDDDVSLDAGLGLGTRLALISLGLIVLFCSLLLLAVVWGPFRSRRAVRDRGPGAFEHLTGQTIGEPGAGVQVLAILPLRTDCHEARIRYLLRLARDHPNRFRLEFMERRSPEGEKELARRGLACATIVVNGRSKFETRDGRAIALTGGPDGSYSLDDLRAVLQEAAQEAYGEEAPFLRAPGDASPSPETMTGRGEGTAP